MRRTLGWVVILVCTRAHADSSSFRVHPTLALRAGLQRTHLWLDEVEHEYGSGAPNGNGFATEVEAGVRFHPQWSASAFVDYARFSVEIDFEYPEFGRLHSYDSRYDELFVGGRVTLHPSARFFIGGAVAWSKVWQRYRPLDAGGQAFDGRLGTGVVQLTVGGELTRIDRVGVQLSIGITSKPSDSEPDHVDLYVPLLVGLVWD